MTTPGDPSGDGAETPPAGRALLGPAFWALMAAAFACILAGLSVAVLASDSGPGHRHATPVGRSGIGRGASDGLR